MKKETIAVAGATGFIGRHLISKLSKDYNVVALTRSKQKRSKSKKIKWKKVDLFSINETSAALKGVDKVIYLIHSMVPSTKFFQGNFTDIDLLLADNVVRASEKAGVKRIIYLGGLIPNGYQSLHLQSRREVEDLFASSSIPTTILRAGIIVGEDGSSFKILKNLVNNLPIMALPKWTNNVTQVIALEDVLRTLLLCCRRSDEKNKSYNLAIGEQVTYLDLLHGVAKKMDKKRLFITTPFSMPSFSKTWVSFFGKTDISLVSPLVDSLLCDFSNIQASQEIEHMIHCKTLDEVLLRSNNIRCKDWLSSIKRYNTSDRAVRSIQRLPRREDINSQQIANHYIQWLPTYFRSFIQADTKEYDKIRFMLFGLCLLELTLVPERSDENRQLFYITEGILVKRKDYGWLEFRQLNNKTHTIAVIHEFQPRLPWLVYTKTQAPLHGFVMKQFSRHLEIA